jgi:hypothetical protein
MTVLGKMQAAIYDALSKDETLTGKVTGIYDMPVTQVATPYIIIGDGAREQPGELLGESYEVSERIQIFTGNSDGFNTAMDIEDAVEGLLSTVAITGYDVVLTDMAKENANLGLVRRATFTVTYLVNA